jgi:hypothetical protein
MMNFFKENVLVLPKFRKIRTLLNKNLLVLPEFLNNKYFGKRISPKNPLKMPEFLKNKYFFNEISPSYKLIPENDDFL